MDEQQARPYMEMAIEEMRKSIPEQRDDQVSPAVGAVLVFPDGTTETAHRGELRDGEHAEYILLERKCATRKLDEAVLFTTLEPCAPGARTKPKKGCSEWICGARIKEVWFGIEDPDPRVATKGKDFLLSKNVKVEVFPSDLQRVINDENREYLDGALERAEKAKEQPTELIAPAVLDAPAARMSISSLSTPALDRYKRRFKLESTEAAAEALADYDLLVPVDGELRPTGFGVLLFGEHPRSRYPQAGVIASVTFPNGRDETKEFDLPLVEIPDAIDQWLSDKVPYVEDRSQMERESGVNLPKRAIREGIVNALIHRDYDIENGKVRLDVKPGAITISSPGRPIPPITLDQVESFSASTLSRNPKLHHIFRQLGLAEEAGRGMQTMKELRREHGGWIPAITFNDPYLVLTLHESAEAAASDIAHRDAADLLTPEELRGWEILLREGGTNRADYAAALGVTTRTASRHLAKFVELGLASREGKSVATRYRPTTGE